MSWLKNHGGALFLAIILLLAFAILPLGSAIEFGGDEGYELMKAFLRGKGFVLYKEIWSDQPPIFTLLLDWSFRWFGTSILTARCVTAVFALILSLCLFDMVRRRVGTFAAWVGTFALLAAPAILEISVSAMQEVPTFGMVLLSAWFLLHWGRRSHRIWLWISGAVMGFALGIKFIAALTFPAMLVELALLTHAKRPSSWPKDFCLNLLQWSLAITLVVGITSFIWGEGSLQSSLSAHFGKSTTNPADTGGETPGDFALSPALFLEHADGTLPALIGLLLVLKQRRWGDNALPIVWLLSALIVHSIHRPWWGYYYLHLAIPFAWLAGLAANEAWRLVSQSLEKDRFRLSAFGTWKGLLVCVLIALALARTIGRLESSVRSLQQRPRVETSLVVAKMKEQAASTHWVYADNPIYAFHARLPMPPELAVVTLKRFWSGQITTTAIVEICRRRHVQQLLLSPVSLRDVNWTNLLAVGFVEECEEGNLKLYGAKQRDSK